MIVDGPRGRVLHVTDLGSASDGVTSALQAAGVDVRRVHLPEETVPDRIVDVDLVIVDTCLGGAALLEVVRTLKRATAAGPRPLLCLTDADHGGPALAELQTLCETVLRQPGESHELLTAVRNLLATDRAETGLAQRERFLCALLESGNDVITVMDADGTIRYESPAVPRVLGYGTGELIGRKAFELIHPEDTGRIQEAFGIIAAPEASTALRFRFRHKNGSWRLLDGVGRNLLHDATVRGIVMTSRDITERAMVHRALRKSEERYRRLLQTAHEGVWLLDAELRTTYVNQRMAAMLGATTDDLLSTSVLDFLDEEAKVEARYYLERRRQGLQEQYDFKLIRRDGTELWVIVCASPVFDDDGVFAGVLAMLTDITERKQVESRIQESERKFRLLFTNNPQPMWVYDAETLAFLEVNDAAVARYEYSRDEFLSMRVTDIAAETDETLVRFGQPAWAGGAGAADPWRHRAKGGSWIEVETVRHSVEFSGRPGILMVVNDVTARRRLEEQLRHSQRIEGLGRLAGGVAHDFNNLLTVIVGRSRLLLENTPESDPRRREVQLITETVDRATDLTRQLLAFSRKQVLEPEVLDVAEVVRAMTLLLGRLIREDIELLVRADAQVPAVRADRGQLEQVIVNLVVNARDAMPQGGRLKIDIVNTVVDEPFAQRVPDATAGPHIALIVSDTGAGMDEHVRTRVFEPFFTTKQQGQGTGLGLATVYGIVRQHGGFITVDSQVGAGSAFTVYLPISQVEATAARPAAAPVVHSHRDATVLVVEDDDSVRQLVADVLRAHDYQVLEARGPAEGMMVAERCRQEIDLLITDVIMPKTSGRTLADLLTIRRPTLRILYMSGYTDDAIAHHGVLEPGAALLQKPFTPAMLVNQVRGVLSDEARADAPAAPAPAVESVPMERGVRLLEPADDAVLETDNLGIGVPPQMLDPFDEALRRLPSSASDLPATPKAARARTKGLVLIVDDEPEISRLLAHDLEEAGYGVTSVTDGEKALTAVIKEEPDVVLLDLGMPRLNGIETLGAIRAIAPLLQVIIVSGGGTMEDAALARSYGAFDYILKPLDTGYLVSRVEAALDADAQNDESLA
jgi:two-component system, cell cycle sensor histidine kinase and response regulator CckA